MKSLINLSLILIFYCFTNLFVACSQQSPVTNDEMQYDTTNIMQNLTPSEQKALNLVKNLPEVKEFLEKNKNAIIEVDHTHNDTVLIHVFKCVVHEEGGMNTATFNWYNVDTKTWKIKKLF
ncbi:MAG: hypothetical protein N3A01_09450 [Bacteroidales bacterium]|nr:hypothetical protein [Bacteroidales bacterium]